MRAQCSWNVTIRSYDGVDDYAVDDAADDDVCVAVALLWFGSFFFVVWHGKQMEELHVKETVIISKVHSTRF